MTQTPLQRAIEQIRKEKEQLVRVSDNAPESKVLVSFLVREIKRLTDLLPYEREVIEQTFQDADKDRVEFENGGKVQYLNANHYFTKTFTNGND